MNTQSLYTADILDLDSLDELVAQRGDVVGEMMFKVAADDYNMTAAAERKADAKVRAEKEAAAKAKRERLADTTITCPKCNGRGVIQCYRHVDNGMCFGCDGEGRLPKEYVLNCNK